MRITIKTLTASLLLIRQPTVSYIANLFFSLRPTVYHSEYLHNGTNNEAELWALLLVLRSLCNVESLLNVQIFTDSLYAMNMALGEWIPRHNLDLISNVQSALELLRARTSVNIL